MTHPEPRSGATGPDRVRDPDVAELEAILREGPWIRRLAHGLLGGRAEADDLSQDVLVAALAAHPPSEPSRLRAWLRTVAHRLAFRSRERDRTRVAVERCVARPEAVDQDALARLRIHRDLAEAIDELDPLYRTALVLRYLEELPPREIAQRLGITPVAARKRVSRGLQLLRTRLDERHRGAREDWVSGLGALLLPSGSSHPFGAPGPQPLAPTAIGTLLPAITLMMKKTLLTAIALGAAAGLFLLVRSIGAPAPGPASDAVAAELSDVQAIGSEQASPENAKGAGRESVAPAAAPVWASPDPHVRIVRADGGLLEGVGAAWLDAGGRVRHLELDASGAAPRPQSSEGAHFFACAPACEETFVSSGAQDLDVELVLHPARVLRGRIVEDGGPPVRPLRVLAFESDRFRGLPRDWRLRQRLEQLGAMRNVPETWTAPDGSFELAGLTHGSEGTLVLPTTHRPVIDGVPQSESSVRFAVGDVALTIETVLLPSVLGRLVWADSGAAVVGLLSIVYEDRETGSGYLTDERIGSDGSFAVGIQVAERALLEPPGARASALINRAVVLGLSDVNGISSGFERRVELTGRPFPIDLGVVRVPRASTQELLVLGPDGAALAGATVVSDLDAATSDIEGRLHLAIGQEDELQVLAPGCALGTFSLAALRSVIAECDEALELRLAAGHTLEVHVGVSSMALPIQLAWQNSPFEGAHSAGAPPFSPMPDRVHRRFHEAHESDENAGRWNHVLEGAPGAKSYRLPPTNVLVVPGLRAGSTFDLRIVDALEQSLLEQPVVLPREPGVHRVDLRTDLERPCRLQVSMVDARGTPLEIAGGVFVTRGDGSRGRNFEFRDGRLDAGPLAAGTYDLKTQIPGFLPVEIAEFSLEPDTPQLVLELEAARRLEVSVADTSGAPVAVQSLRLEDGAGWSDRQQDVELGRAVFARVPLRPLTFTLRIGTGTFTSAVDAATERCEVTVPPHGRLVIQLTRPPDLATDNGHVRATIRAAEGDGELTVSLWFTDEAADALSLGVDLAPGAFELELELVEWADDALDGDEPLTRSLDSRALRIDAGVETRVLVEP